MKKTILSSVLALAVSFTFAQKDDKKTDAKTDTKAAAAAPAQAANVPAAIKTKFASLYPSAKDIAVWKEEKDTYVASFEQNKYKTAVVFDGAGNLAETRTEIKISELPEKAGPYVKKNFGKSAKITKAVRITDAKGVVTYECTVKDKIHTFDGKGKYLGENAE